MSIIEANLDELQVIRTLIEKGEFEDAMKSIANLPEDKILEGNILKSRVLRYQLNFQAANTLIQETLPLIQSLLLKLDALIEQAYVLFSTRKFEIGWESIYQAEAIFQSILSESPENNPELKDLESKLYRVKARYLFLENIDQAYVYIQKSLKICETTGNMHQLAGIHRSLGHYYLDRINIDQALKHFHNSLEKYQQVGNNEAQRNNYMIIAEIYDERGNLDLALEYAKRNRSSKTPKVVKGI